MVFVFIFLISKLAESDGETDFHIAGLVVIQGKSGEEVLNYKERFL